MTTLDLVLLTFLIVILAASLAAVIRAVHADGLGHRPVPRSHESWDAPSPGDPLRL